MTEQSNPVTLDDFIKQFNEREQALELTIEQATTELKTVREVQKRLAGKDESPSD